MTDEVMVPTTEKKETTGEAFIRELLAGADKEQLNAFMREVNQTPLVPEPKYKKPHNGPVIQYTTVIKKYSCLICGATFAAKYEMQKGEHISTIDPDGKCHLITITGKAGEIEVPSTVSKCSFCTKLVNHWTREELENNFLLLLSQMSFKEKVNYTKARAIVRAEGEVRI